MAETPIFQNIDTPEVNPLEKNQTAVLPSQSAAPSDQTTTRKLSLPKDPKIIALFALAAILILLTVVAILVSITRQAPNNKKILPTPTTHQSSSPVPSVANQNIPTQFIEKFLKIDQESKIVEDFMPPKIDINIGL